MWQILVVGLSQSKQEEAFASPCLYVAKPMMTDGVSFAKLLGL